MRRTETGQGVHAIDVHRAAAADALAAASPEGQGGIDLVLNPDQGVEHHGAGLVEVERVRLHLGLLRRPVGRPSVDVEGLGLCILARDRLSGGVGASGDDGP